MNHNMNGRGKVMGVRGMRMQMINWLDAPDDVYFVATDATRYIKNTFEYIHRYFIFGL